MRASSYRRPEDMPVTLSLFPLRGVILLPRATLPLNVFEPRYLQLVDDALRGDRLIGIIQPAAGAATVESPREAVPLRRYGCAGRLTAYQETGDGRVQISLTGIARFSIEEELASQHPYRQVRASFAPFAHDFTAGSGEAEVDRERLLRVLKAYLESHNMSADWQSINRAGNEHLVNTLSVISPYGPEEKQALLEAPSLSKRCEVLMTLAEMQMASPEDGSGSALQ
jgi:hypothetical protein